MTNFPNGVASFGIPVLPGSQSADLGSRSGNVFWADSGYTGGASNGSFARPDLTVAAAVARAAADNGDTVYVKDGHAETLGATTSWAKAGVAIVGLGTKSSRPTFTMNATTSQVVLSAARQVLSNMIFNSTIDAVVAVVSITAANVQLYDVEFRDGLVTTEALIDVLTDAGADDLTLRTKHVGFAGGDAKTHAIKLIGVVNADINIDFFGNVTTGVIEMLTTVCQNINISGRIVNHGGSSGVLVPNNTNIVQTGALIHTYQALVWDGNAPGGFMRQSNQYSGITLLPDVPYQPAGGDSTIVESVDTLTVSGAVGTLFRVTGMCLITEAIGEVTTTVTTSASTMLYALTYGSTTPFVFCSPTADLATIVAPYYIKMPWTVVEIGAQSSSTQLATADALLSTVSIGGHNTFKVGGTASNDFIASSKSTITGTAGVVRWRLKYAPLSPGAKITPLTQA